jgi:hypothetical protein
MTGNGYSSRRGRFETLEPKHMLAGDVVLELVDGRLEIEGDALGNNIEITAGANGSLVISGLDGTTVHEEGETPAAEVTLTGVTRGIRVDLGDGDDTLAISDVSLRGNVSIETGDGNDTVMIGAEGDVMAGSLLDDLDASVALRGSLSVDTGEGNDDVTVASAAVRGRLSIDTGIGEDTVSLGAEAAPMASLLGGLPGGPLGDVDLEASLHVRGGAHVELGDGNDELDVNGVRVHTFASVHGGDGDDDIRVNHSAALGLVIAGQDGDDTVSLDGVHARFLGLSTGDGEDDVSIVDSVFMSLGVSLGADNDTLLTDSLTARFAALLGGDGEDTHNVAGESELRHELVLGFELPPDVVNTSGLPRLRGLLNGHGLGHGLRR